MGLLPEASSSTYATLCAVLCGVANMTLWCAFDTNFYVNESAVHSVNGREPTRMGPHDGYYGMGVSNAAYMISTLAVPTLSSYLRCKWLLALSAALFSLYFLAFLALNRIVYFLGCAVLGLGFSAFNVGWAGYLTEFSTRHTLARNQALSWAVTCVAQFGATLTYILVTRANMNENGVVPKYREYSDTEIRVFYGAFSLLGGAAVALYCLLPNKNVEGNIAATNVKCKSLVEQLSVMRTVLFHPRVLTLVPFYLYIGFFYSFNMTVFPVTLQFTKSLSHDAYMPAYFGVTFAVGGIVMSALTMKLSKVVHNFSFKPLMIINALVQVVIFALCVAAIPEWSTVRPNDAPALLIEPSLGLVLLLSFLFGLADSANATTRTVLSALLVPERRQHVFGASRFYHALAASAMFFASPSISIYAYVVLLSVTLLAATAVYLYTCGVILKEERVAAAESAASVSAKQLEKADEQ